MKKQLKPTLLFRFLVYAVSAFFIIPIAYALMLLFNGEWIGLLTGLILLGVVWIGNELGIIPELVLSLINRYVNNNSDRYEILKSLFFRETSFFSKSDENKHFPTM